MDANNFKPILSQKFNCEMCDFKSSKLCNLRTHILSTKHQKAHKMLTNANENKQKQADTIFECECGKQFSHNPSLSRHKKKCLFINSTEKQNSILDASSNEVIVLTNLVLEMVKSNGDLQKQVLEVSLLCEKNVTNNNTTNNSNNNINSHNKTFNLQFFLNETCKDAMNIMDFVDSIKIQMSDIESIGELGFVNGMSKLIIKNLNALAENMRPVHCNDPKRDSLYVKDANVWEKEGSDNKKIKKAIKYISHKNICFIPQWKAKYPDCIYSDSKKSNQYNHIVVEAMGGPGDNDEEKADKIVKKIAKEVTIDK
jgi:hypothetical protein